MDPKTLKEPQRPNDTPTKPTEPAKQRLRSIASSTAIETGESVQHVEERIIRLRARRERAPLA